MERATFQSIDPHIDRLAERFETLLRDEGLADVRAILTEISKRLGERYSAEIEFRLLVVDHLREQSLPLLTTALYSTDGAELSQGWGDCSPEKYVVAGEIQIVPHDRCPRCWGIWDRKEKCPECPDCEAVLGADVKILIDGDVCPHCEKGKVTMANPTCDRCGHMVDPDFVHWG